VLASSSYVREVRERHRLKSFVRDSVRNAGNYREMEDACACKGTVSIGDKFAV
jgi:hypothetical protein